MTLNQARLFKMPHGNHKNCPLEILPIDYLEWVSIEWSGEKLKQAAKLVLKYRKSLANKSILIDNKNKESKHSVDIKNNHDFTNGAFGELKRILDNAKPNLF